MEAPKSRERRPAPERRAQILEAAASCIAEKGFHAATMDDLAQAAGLSKGSLYWHFKSKDDVFLALCDAVATSTFEAWDAREGEGSTFERFDTVVLQTLEQGSQLLELRPVWTEFFTHRSCRDRIAELYRAMRWRLAEAFERDGAEGRPLRGSPTAAAALLVGVIEGLGLQAMVDPEFDLKSHWVDGVEVLRGGFG